MKEREDKYMENNTNPNVNNVSAEEILSSTPGYENKNQNGNAQANGGNAANVTYVQVNKIPGYDNAVIALILGICSIVLQFPLLNLGLAIGGLVLANKSKKEGYAGGIRTAGFITSVIGLVLAAFTVVFACVYIGGIFGLFGCGILGAASEAARQSALALII